MARPVGGHYMDERGQDSRTARASDIGTGLGRFRGGGGGRPPVREAHGGLLVAAAAAHLEEPGRQGLAGQDRRRRGAAGGGRGTRWASRSGAMLGEVVLDAGPQARR